MSESYFQYWQKTKLVLGDWQHVTNDRFFCRIKLYGHCEAMSLAWWQNLAVGGGISRMLIITIRFHKTGECKKCKNLELLNSIFLNHICHSYFLLRVLNLAPTLQQWHCWPFCLDICLIKSYLWEDKKLEIPWLFIFCNLQSCIAWILNDL